MRNIYEWKLTDIYGKKEEFIRDKDSIAELLEKIQKFKGNLKNAENIKKCYNLYEQIIEKICKIYAYGMFKYHKNMESPESIEAFREAENIDAQIDEKISFIVPEITEINEETVNNYIKNEDLKEYRRNLEKIVKNKKHVLSKELEETLSNFSEVFNGSKNAYEILTNAEIKFPEVEDKDKNKFKLSESVYSKLLLNTDVVLRKNAAKTLLEEYGKYENTITEIYLTKVKEYTKISKIRKYKNSLERATNADEATIDVYNKLIYTINKNIKEHHKYVSLKKKLLKLKEMHMYDTYLNPFVENEASIPIEEAKATVIKALQPLGNKYIEKLKEAFESNWMDVYTLPNKKTGAYNMSVYGVHPFVLLNYEGTNDDVSTIAHEFGHAMHSYYSCSNQNVLNCNYSILLAEIASTVNEFLLAEYRIRNVQNINEKMAILYDRIELIEKTLIIQTMFAEFEENVHRKIESGEILNAKSIDKLYLELFKKYYGDALELDDFYKFNWIRIPHFYSCFYVYKYATGISSAIAIVKKILKKEEGYTEKYLNMLKSGGSKETMELLKMVDVDLETKKPYEDAIEFFRNDIEELERLYEENK